MIETGIAIALVFLLQLATPFWWWVMAVPFCVALVRPMSAWAAFRMGLSSAGIVWLFAAGILLMWRSQIIASRVALMMNMGDGWILLLSTVIIAMSAGGIAGTAGQALRRAWISQRHSLPHPPKTHPVP